jgi:hypothetical protein
VVQVVRVVREPFGPGHAERVRMLSIPRLHPPVNFLAKLGLLDLLAGRRGPGPPTEGNLQAVESAPHRGVAAPSG